MATSHKKKKKEEKFKKGKTWKGMTAKMLLKNKSLAIFRILRTVLSSVVDRIPSLEVITEITDTITIIPDGDGNVILSGAISSPIEPRYIKRRGADISTGRALATLNGHQVDVPQSTVVIKGKVTVTKLKRFIKQLGSYDHKAERGFPYVTLCHKGTKGRTIEQSLKFIVEISAKLKAPA